jgi:hypothetical protein
MRFYRFQRLDAYGLFARPRDFVFRCDRPFPSFLIIAPKYIFQMRCPSALQLFACLVYPFHTCRYENFKHDRLIATTPFPTASTATKHTHLACVDPNAGIKRHVMGATQLANTSIRFQPSIRTARITHHVTRSTSIVNQAITCIKRNHSSINQRQER